MSDLPTCWFRRFGFSECSGRMDRMHFIPAQRLRKAGLSVDEVWSTAVWRPACRRHHHLLDNHFIRIARADLPASVEDFARQHGLEWSLERDYGPSWVLRGSVANEAPLAAGWEAA